jgi:aminocarboxymuconate-semialdehyde decarboxylase
LDHGYAVKPVCRTALNVPPGQWLDRLYYDTIIFHESTLRFLIETVGPDQVMLGSDYPFDDGEADPVGFVQRIADLPDEARAAILGENAARLLKYEHHPAES